MLTAFYEITRAAYFYARILFSCLERLSLILSYDACKLSIIAALAFLPFLLTSLLISAYISDRYI